jgi:hypothetical protein
MLGVLTVDPVAPDATAVGTTLMSNIGSTVVNATTGLLPIAALWAIPLAVLGAIGAKFGITGRKKIRV